MMTTKRFPKIRVVSTGARKKSQAAFVMIAAVDLLWIELELSCVAGIEV